MAEFALGLTKTAVDGTLSRVKSAIEEEGKLKVRVQNDLLFITGEFQMMQSFLNAANKERAKNEVVRTWVRQLRDLAFDVEDCVEFVVHLDNKSAWWWRVVPSCMAPPLPLDEAVAEIKQLKARVEDVSLRNTRYNLISDSGSGSKPVSPSPAEQPAVATAGAGSSAFHMLRQVWEVAGKRREMGDLQELITRQSSDLQVISLWGSTGGDLGTTSIFRKAYCDPNVCQEFKSRAWVKLRDPFNPDEFLSSLLTQFCKSSGMANYVGVEDELVKAKLMQQLINKQRYLVILEQVSTVVEWDAIKMCLPDSKNGSRIIMSTQDLGIALLCTGEPYLALELRQFSDGQSLCALFKKIPGHRSDMGELKWQIKRRGVISVHGSTQSKSDVVKRLYRNILHKREEFDGVEFEKCRWVHPFDLTDFSRRLFLEHIQDDCLVVIDGLQSIDDWNSIKSTFLSEPTKGSIIVITNNDLVARQCVDDEHRALNSKDFISDFAEGHVFSSGREEAHDWTNSFKLVGHQLEAYDLYVHLRNPGVISVWGIAGIGKSALVRSTYYSQMLGLLRVQPKYAGYDWAAPRKFAKYSWVDVPHPFNLTDLSRRIFLDFHSDDLQAKEAAAVGIIEGQDPIQGCRKFLREYECLVVIDGLRSKDDWDLIKAAFLSGPTKGNIIVITHEETVARHCVEDKNRPPVVNVKGLDADAALDLFTKKALGDKQLTSGQMELSKLIVAKCGGIPQVIASVGEFLGRRIVLYVEDFSATYLFKDINDHFMGELQTHPEFHSLSGLFCWMQSYFDACSDSLKPCIFYLSVFPVGHNIRQKRLLRRWIAESYSRDTFDRTAEEKGKMLFSELVDLSIIQQPPGDVPCQTNGFFHEYISSRPMEDNLVFALEGHCDLNSQRTGQHLTISSNWDRDKIVFESIDFSRLRSLTVFGEWRPFFISTNANMRLLRVLDLEDTSGLTNDDLEQIGELLPRLKFLSLRGCREITVLPDSLGGLRQLQTLDVRYTLILMLPPAIIKLNKLQYIRAGTTKSESPWEAKEGGMVTNLSAQDSAGTGPSQTLAEDSVGTGSRQAAAIGVVQSTSSPSRSRPHALVSTSWLCCKRKPDNGSVEVPAGIGNLKTLHTIGVINLSGAGGKAILKEIKKLTQLRKLGIAGINRENAQEFCAAISGHLHMESLSVRVDKDKKGAFACLDDIPQPPKTIKRLKVGGHVRKLPVWIKQLDNLKKLDLEMTIFTQEDIHALGIDFHRSHVLHRLCVKLIQDGELQFCSPKRRDFVAQYNLKVLRIDCSSRLQVTFDFWITKSVQLLIIHCSSGSSLRISGLENLPYLNQVWLKGSYGGELKRELQQQLSDHRMKPILKVEQPRSS